MDFTPFQLLVRHAREFCHSRLREAGVNDTEHLICVYLSFHSDVNQESVARSLRLDKTTVARSLLSLEQRGLVSRQPDPRNRRQNLLTVTEQGRETIHEVLHVYDEWLTTVSGCLSPAEQQVFQELLARMLEKARELA